MHGERRATSCTRSWLQLFSLVASAALLLGISCPRLRWWWSLHQLHSLALVLECTRLAPALLQCVKHPLLMVFMSPAARWRWCWSASEPAPAADPLSCCARRAWRPCHRPRSVGMGQLRTHVLARHLRSLRCAVGSISEAIGLVTPCATPCAAHAASG